MKEITLSNKTYLFVEVPDDATDFHYDSHFNRYVNHSKGAIKLDVNTKIICTTKDIIEELDQNYYGTTLYTSAKESLQSLIQVNSLDINKNYLILLKL